MNDTLLSIIITCYNNDWCVNEAIESIKSITYDNWECIIINDGSTDNSEAVIQNTIKDDKRFRLITTSNNGVAKARNLGLFIASGDYCIFLDSDDLIMSDYPLFSMKYMLKHHECPLFFGSVKCTGIINSTIKSIWKGYAHMLKEPCIFISATFKRKRALEIGGFKSELEAFEDYDFWIRYLYHNSYNVKNTLKLMIIYRTRANSRHFLHKSNELCKIKNKIKQLNRDIYNEYDI